MFRIGMDKTAGFVSKILFCILLRGLEDCPFRMINDSVTCKMQLWGRFSKEVWHPVCDLDILWHGGDILWQWATSGLLTESMLPQSFFTLLGVGQFYGATTNHSIRFRTRGKENRYLSQRKMEHGYRRTAQLVFSLVKIMNRLSDRMPSKCFDRSFENDEMLHVVSCLVSLLSPLKETVDSIWFHHNLCKHFHHQIHRAKVHASNPKDPEAEREPKRSQDIGQRFIILCGGGGPLTYRKVMTRVSLCGSNRLLLSRFGVSSVWPNVCVCCSGWASLKAWILMADVYGRNGETPVIQSIGPSHPVIWLLHNSIIHNSIIFRIDLRRS